MDDLIYPRERTLGRLTLVLGLIAWVLIIVGTFGIALIYVAFGFVFYLFAQSGLIAWLRGTAVRLSDQQLPDLYRQYLACCQKLQMAEPPEAYVLQGDGIMNAFATRFLRRNFVVVLSDTMDAMRTLPDGINFYFGHELGHIKQGHLLGSKWRLPVLWLPLLGAAYSRAQEYTCDRHGRACCEQPESAARALAVLAAGAEKWRAIDLNSYTAQIQGNRGFFADFHELLNGYPWLTKRVARAREPDAPMPSRNVFSYVLGLFIPYGGRGGGGALSFLIVLVAIIGILAAVALPAYQDYQGRIKFTQAWHAAEPVRTALGDYYSKHHEVPDDLAKVGISAEQAGTLEYDSDSMTLSVKTPAGNMVMVPQDSGDTVTWQCVGTGGRAVKYLPLSCRADAQGDAQADEQEAEQE